ncbi:anti-sigma-I factor RsgI family protein [Bacillus massilinigeriensis]|uniref:anti-sigma-I factor RsgI family protein n=1 Tax=Bacillus mediterraneensis TaxID=1805474 RepID=UPI0008F843D6|nr:anti-sigma factor domain-containing protein [Bacillus mediterraneensis]
MRKGIILEVNDLYVTLLTPEGEFMKTRKLRKEYPLGGEIQFLPLEEAAPAIRKKRLALTEAFKRSKAGALISAVILLFAFSVPMFNNNQVYAYLSIDVNPSIEMGLNEDLRVVKIKAYNDDGKTVLSGLKEWKSKDANTVAEMLLERMKELGYMKKNHDVLIATVPAKKGKADSKLKKTVKKIKAVTKEENLRVTVLSVTEKEREIAKSKGLTPGLYKENKLHKVNEKHSKEIRSKGSQNVKKERTLQKPAGNHDKQGVIVTPQGSKEDDSILRKQGEARRPDTLNPSIPSAQGNNGYSKEETNPNHISVKKEENKQPPGQEKGQREKDANKAGKGLAPSNRDSDGPRPKNWDKPGNGYGRDKENKGKANGQFKDKSNKKGNGREKNKGHG